MTPESETHLPDAEVVPTPFHAAAAAHSKTNDWTTWDAFTVANVYSSADEEYQALRRGVAVCDYSPLPKYRLSGADASIFLARLVTRTVDALKVSQSAFSPYCDDRGHVIDFARYYRLGVSDFVLHTSELARPWLEDTAYGLRDLIIDDVSNEMAILGVHGVASGFALLLMGLNGVEQLAPGEMAAFRLKDLELQVVRSRRYGELGYDIWVRPTDATIVWDRLFRASRKLNPKPVGRYIQNICRLEAGHLELGVDFIGAHSALFANRPRTPIELGLEECLDMSKPHFVGRSALLTSLPRTRVVGLNVDGESTFSHGRLTSSGRLVGSVSSVAWSPRLARIIALATVATSHADLETELSIEVPEMVELEPEVTRRAATIVDRRFYASPAKDAATRHKS